MQFDTLNMKVRKKGKHWTRRMIMRMSKTIDLGITMRPINLLSKIVSNTIDVTGNMKNLSIHANGDFKKLS
jgi:hypothetical protein